MYKKLIYINKKCINLKASNISLKNVQIILEQRELFQKFSSHVS